MLFSFFQKAMENVRKDTKDKRYLDTKVVTKERRRNYLVSELNYHKLSYFFTENLLAIEMRKTDILMNKPVYLRFSILELSKILMYEFWYDYLNMVKKQSSVI